MNERESRAPTAVAVRRHYVDGRHGQMHVRLAGDGAGARPPLVCIHMSPMTGRVFERFLGVVATDRRALAFDTPGFGLSDAPPAPPGIEDYAVDILAGLDALGIAGPVDVMGYHTGSKTAVALARYAPGRIRRVVMVSAPVFSADELQGFHAYYAATTPDADGTHLVKRWRGFVYHYLRPGVTLDDVADVFPEALLGRARDWWGHRAAFEYALADNLHRVAQPVLILNPGDDLDVQTRRADGLAPRSRLLEVPAWGHGFLDLHTTEVADLVRSFLDAADADPFRDVRVPPSGAGERYPPRVGSFPPDSRVADPRQA